MRWPMHLAVVCHPHHASCKTRFHASANGDGGFWRKVSFQGISFVAVDLDNLVTITMNMEDKLEGMGMLLKCGGGGGGGGDGGRMGPGSAGGLVVMTMGQPRSLVNHPLLAAEDEDEDDDEEEEEDDDDDDDDEEEDLTESSLVTHDLVPPEQLMVHEEATKSDAGGEMEVHFPLKLSNKMPCSLHMPLSIKQELKLSEPLDQMKREKKQAKELTACAKKKKRKQHSPAKVQILTINDDGSLGHQNPKSHVCVHCNAAFRTNYHLQRHVFIHTGEKPFQCSQCDMRFIQKYLLQRHEKIHTGEKPFRCDECGMRFIQKYHMERHKRTHSGEKPYQCDYCHQYFSRTDRVLKHRRMCHERERKAHKAAAGKTGPPRDTDNLSLSFPAKESSAPKKKRQKCSGDKVPGSSVSSTAAQVELQVLSVPATDEEEKEEEEAQRRGKIESLPLYAVTSKVKHEYVIADYSMELPEEPASRRTPESEASPKESRPPRLVLKKVPKKNLKQSSELPPASSLSPLSSFEDSSKVTRYTFEIVDKQGLLDVDGNGELEHVEALPGGQTKPASSSTNYDDAMQFLKKKRYLQAAMATNNSRDYALNASGVSSQPSVVTQAVVSTVIDENVPATILEPQPIGAAEMKATHDKNVLPDEVLQTLLDHYSNKANGQSDISFSVADTEVTSSISINSSEVSADGPAETLGASSAPPQPPAEKVSLLHEYSKFLQQALERTSQNDSYLSSQSLNLGTENPTLAGQPLFSNEKQFPSPGRGVKSGMSSPLRSTLEKPHFSLLVGDSQHSFSFSGDETTSPSAVSPSEEDFLEQVSPSKKSDSPQAMLQTFQISTFDQNFLSHFQSSRSGGASSQFTIANGQVSLRAHGTDFAEFPLVAVAETRSQLNSSPDVSSSETFG
ncbi:Zinc finger protein 148 [Merluccius polli]|uniref:Zinc finger protein 148 n=1 Tax=Merluccius polli TaxID=89951 RepID=A0AA47N9A7_MERPO|nr:Zinc finger protein 148 [Merluccius polli]